MRNKNNYWKKKSKKNSYWNNKKNNNKLIQFWQFLKMISLNILQNMIRKLYNLVCHLR